MSECAQVVFTEKLLPEIQSRAAVMLASQSAEAREEGEQEIMAQAWAGFWSAWERGKADTVTAFTLTDFACRHYWEGRRIAGTGRLDAMSERSRASGKVRLTGIEEASPRQAGTDPAEAIRWRLDFACVIGRLNRRQRLVLALLLMEWKTGEIAERIGVSSGRVVHIVDEVGEAFAQAGYGPA